MSRRPAGVLSVALLAAVTGVFVFIANWRSYWHLPSVMTDTSKVIGVFRTALVAVMLTIPVLKLVTAGGLMMLRRWAWAIAIPVLAFDVMYRAQAALKFYTYGSPGIIPRGNLGGTVVKTGSLWTSNAIAIIGLASLIVLMRKPIVEAFVGPSARDRKTA
jgi:hypothetical protein